MKKIMMYVLTFSLMFSVRTIEINALECYSDYEILEITSKDFTRRTGGMVHYENGFVSMKYRKIGTDEILTTTDFELYNAYCGNNGLNMDEYPQLLTLFYQQLRGTKYVKLATARVTINDDVFVTFHDGDDTKIEKGIYSKALDVNKVPVPNDTENFVGWFTEEGGKGEQYLPTDILMDDMEVYAHYKENESTTIDIETKDVSLLTTDTYNPADGFVSMTITTNGVPESYTYEQFQTMGGTTSSITTPLKAGTQTVTYAYGSESKTSTLHITDYSFTAKDLNLKESNSYTPEDSFVELVITDPQGMKTSHDLEKFEALGGTVTTNVPTPLSEGTYQTVYTLNGVSETATIEVEADDVVIDIETKDVSLLTTDTYNPADGFVSMTITTNGVPESYTYNQFQTMGGTTSSITTPLKAGTQTVTYAYGSESKISTLHITDYSFTVENLTIKESNSYTPEDSFVELVITDPQGMKTSHDLEKFEALGGTVTTNVPTPLSEGTYQTVYTLNGVSETATIEVEADDVVIPEVLDVTFVDKNHSTIALVEANKLINPHDIPEIHPEKGETFVGWFTEENGAGVEFNPMTELVTESIVVYAHYETSVYTVLFEVNGTITKTEIKHGHNIDPDMVPNPEMPNLKFIGWERISISRMFQEQPQYFDIENDIVTDNMMLRAVYEDDEVLPEEPQEPQEPETPEKTDEVKESKKETLPITGLTQTSVASYIGLIVMIAGLVLLIISRKKRNENK